MFPSVRLRHVEDVQKVMRSHLRCLVPGDLPDGDAAAMWQAFDAIERQAAAAKTLLAVRVEESRSWAKAGDRSAVEHMARRSGTSPGAVRSGLETSRRLAQLPATEAALRRGDLSPAQADTISEAASVNPGAEQSLLQAARHSPLARLRDQANRAKAAGDPDPDATHRRLHRQRRLRRFTDGEGAWNLQARGTVDAGAVVNAALDPIVDEIFHQARRDDRHEARDNYAFDALVELARRARGQHNAQPATTVVPTRGDNGDAGSPSAATSTPGAPASATGPARTGPATRGGVGGDDSPHPPAAGSRRSGRDGDVRPARPAPTSDNPSYLALVRVDADALVRGRVKDDELCEIAGVGAVPASVARRMLGDAVLKLVITRGVDVVNVTHLGRGPTAAQKVALLWTSPACTNTNCTHTLAIEHDHRTPWTELHETRVGNLDRLCRPCHRLKTHEGWALVEGEGRRPLVPPDDSRHVNHRGLEPPADPSVPRPAARSLAEPEVPSHPDAVSDGAPASDRAPAAPPVPGSGGIDRQPAAGCHGSDRPTLFGPDAA